MLGTECCQYGYKIILYLCTGLNAAPTGRGGVTNISKENVREIRYYQANCIVFLPK